MGTAIPTSCWLLAVSARVTASELVEVVLTRLPETIVASAAENEREILARAKTGLALNAIPNNSVDAIKRRHTTSTIKQYCVYVYNLGTV